MGARPYQRGGGWNCGPRIFPASCGFNYKASGDFRRCGHYADSAPSCGAAIYCIYIKSSRADEDYLRSRQARLDAARTRVDFENASQVFAGPTFDQVDDRYDYGETRIITVGRLGERMMIVVWTPRGETRLSCR